MRAEQQIAPTAAQTRASASSVRWQIMCCITLVTTLTYVDRLNLSIAAKYIQDEFSFSTHTMGWVFSAFLLGYALFQIPGGWAGDRYGPKNVLALAILFWSVFTALTGLAPKLILHGWINAVAAFMIIRFPVGAGEAATSPNGNKIVANWMGSGRRGTGASFTILGVGLGGAITPPLIAWIMQKYGWRTSFYIAGALGLIVVLVWQALVTNTPEEHPRVNRAELELIQAGRDVSGLVKNRRATPWGQLISTASCWGLFLGYFCQGFPIYFYHTWFFLYLIQVRHLGITQGGLWGATPYLAIAALAPLGGLFSDFAVRRMGKRWGRRATISVGMFSSASLLWVGSNTASNTAAVIALAVGGGMNMFAASTFWATCIDLTQEFTGSLSGLMNTFGNLGGWLSPIVTAYVATSFGWNRALDCAAAVSIASGLFFLLVKADRSIDAESLPAAAKRGTTPMADAAL
jgi:ACS family glucarate transporter-like MFS transporter